ncbi:MAG: DNA-directed RNA polymerase subunit P [Candidatus Micrarchaeia archaeon]
MGYICAKCKRKVKEGLRCQYCGSRIIIKERPNLAKEISTD